MMRHKMKSRAKKEIFAPGQSRKAGGDYGEEYQQGYADARDR